MPWFEIVWTPTIVDHLCRHGVSQDEFQEVVFKARKVEPNKSAGRFEVPGLTSSRRLIKCVFEPIDEVSILPVTAFEP